MDRIGRESGMATVAAFMIVAAWSVCAEEKIKRTVVSAAAGSPEPLRRIVISIPDRKLALVEGNRTIKIWRTAVGTESTPSPGGTYRIVSRVFEPAYYQPGKVVPPGPANPVGTRWLGLSLKGFGIHGTNNPGSIGRKASHGCIRMRNRDVEELFDLVRVGDVVELHRKRDGELAAIFGAAKSKESKPDVATAAAVALASVQQPAMNKEEAWEKR